jgi:hypothetical protein
MPTTDLSPPVFSSFPPDIHSISSRTALSLKLFCRCAAEEMSTEQSWGQRCILSHSKHSKTIALYSGSKTVINFALLKFRPRPVSPRNILSPSFSPASPLLMVHTTPFRSRYDLHQCILIFMESATFAEQQRRPTKQRKIKSTKHTLIQLSAGKAKAS